MYRLQKSCSVSIRNTQSQGRCESLRRIVGRLHCMWLLQLLKLFWTQIFCYCFHLLRIQVSLRNLQYPNRFNKLHLNYKLLKNWEFRYKLKGCLLKYLYHWNRCQYFSVCRIHQHLMTVCIHRFLLSWSYIPHLCRCCQNRRNFRKYR